MQKKTPTICPCDTGLAYRDCCRPLHRGEVLATSALQLMRSRYSAYARHDSSYIHASWASDTRPSIHSLLKGPQFQWTGLEIVDQKLGRQGDLTGWVTFKATYQENDQSAVLEECSRFDCNEGRWFYTGPQTPV